MFVLINTVLDEDGLMLQQQYSTHNFLNESFCTIVNCVEYANSSQNRYYHLTLQACLCTQALGPKLTLWQDINSYKIKQLLKTFLYGIQLTSVHRDRPSY